MIDTALMNAVQIRDEMAAEIADAEAKIKACRARMERAERFIGDWEEFSGQSAPAPAVVARTPDDVVQRRMDAKAKNPKKEEVAQAAVALLREHGSPMSRTDLMNALAERGIVVHGTRPEVVLQTMLWRTKHIVAHLKGYGYWPAADDYEPAGYNVEDEAEIAEEGGEENFQDFLSDIDQQP